VRGVPGLLRANAPEPTPEIRGASFNAARGRAVDRLRVDPRNREAQNIPCRVPGPQRDAGQLARLQAAKECAGGGPLTLCIAALSDMHVTDPFAGERAVVAHDVREWNGIAAADDGQKSFYLGSDWVGLASGHLGEAKEVAVHLRIALKAAGAVKDTLEALDALRSGIRLHHRSLADRYVGCHVGPLTYADFLDKGPRSFGEERFEKAYKEILALQYSSELLAVGWVGQRFRIYQYDKWDGDKCYRWEERDYYAAIGSGQHVAEIFFRGRQHRWFATLERALYTVYEAQVNASKIDPLVGNRGHILVLRREGGTLRQQEVSHNGGLFLADQEKVFGLKELTANSIPKLPDGFFDSHEWTVT
jgi:hypothetical protein